MRVGNAGRARGRRSNSHERRWNHGAGRERSYLIECRRRRGGYVSAERPPAGSSSGGTVEITRLDPSADRESDCTCAFPAARHTNHLRRCDSHPRRIAPRRAGPNRAGRMSASGPREHGVLGPARQPLSPTDRVGRELGRASTRYWLNCRSGGLPPQFLRPRQQKRKAPRMELGMVGVTIHIIRSDPKAFCETSVMVACPDGSSQKIPAAARRAHNATTETIRLISSIRRIRNKTSVSVACLSGFSPTTARI